MGVDYSATEGVYDGVVACVGGQDIGFGMDIADDDFYAGRFEKLDVGAFVLDC